MRFGQDNAVAPPRKLTAIRAGKTQASKATGNSCVSEWSACQAFFEPGSMPGMAH
jgi:hypothetical protein